MTRCRTLIFGLLLVVQSTIGQNYKSNPFLNNGYANDVNAFIADQERVNQIDMDANVFLSHAISNRAAGFSGPQYLPPKEKQQLICSGQEVCVRKNSCNNGYFTQKQQGGSRQDCDYDTEVCCLYKPPPPPPTQVPSTPCTGNNYACVAPNICQNGEIKASNFLKSQPAGKCYAPEVCCRIPEPESTVLDENGYHLKVPQNPLVVPTQKPYQPQPYQPTPGYQPTIKPYQQTPKPYQPTPGSYQPQPQKPYQPQQPYQPQPEKPYQPQPQPQPQQPYQPEPQKPYQPQPQKPYQPEPQKPYQPQPQPQKPYQPEPQKPYQPQPQPQKPYQPQPQKPYQPQPQPKQPYQPEPQKPYQPQPQPKQPYQPEPQKPYQPQPQKPYQPEPQKPYQPEPQKPYQPQPQKPYQPQPQPNKPYQPEPQKPYQPQPQPQKPYQPEPQKPYQPQPQKPYQPQPQPQKPYPTPSQRLPTTTAPQYLPPTARPTPPRRGEDQLSLPIPRPDRPRPPLIGNDILSEPQLPQTCAAALNCTRPEYCSATGVIQETPVVLTADQELFRVPMTKCQDQIQGFAGVCCRDPNYVDPWPVSQLGQYNAKDFGDDGTYKPNPGISRPQRRVANVNSPKINRQRQRQVPSVQCVSRNTNTVLKGVAPIDADFAEYPWQTMVLLESTKSLLCGGAIISDDIVATAAHCVTGRKPFDVLIKAGEWKLGRDEEPLTFQISRAKKIEIHPNYDPSTSQYDIALLYLDSPLKFETHIGPICIDDTDPSSSEECVTTGWGKEVLRVHAQDAIMHHSPVTAVSRDQCSVDESRVCGKPDIDGCELDPGSALACKNSQGQYVLKGIFSKEDQCGNSIIRFTKPDAEWINLAILSKGRTVSKILSPNSF